MAVSGAKRLFPLKGNQGRASDPARNVWLSASAGTGKTQVLAARVWRLLLAGVEPGAILCLTFTKAGAAEMTARINERLARWVRAPDPELAQDLEALGEDYGPEARARARTLFAKVLDAPGMGLRIQTIHSFCQSLLAAFPIEAGLVPGFRPLEAREEAALARDTLAEMLVAAEREGRAALIDAVGALSTRLGEEKAEAFLRECARAPDAMAALPSGLQPFVRRALDLPTGDFAQAIAECCADDRFDVESLRLIASLNAGWGTKSGLERADIAAAWIAGGASDRAAGLRALHAIWAKADGEPRSFGKGQAPQEAAYAEAAMRLHGRCGELIAMEARAHYADLLAQGLMAGREYSAAYARAKSRIGAVDFDDLIRRTVALLGQPGMGQWVRFKLDSATEHLLIDEAQDTNRRQWEIVRAMADEFFAGEGTRGAGVRTLFTVGDYKQAIFGFQGTSPLFFAEAHRHFERLAAGASEADVRELETLSLTHSFRSTRPVLEFVDAAIAGLPVPGLGPMGDVERHASEVAGPGAVTLWPPVVAESDEVADDEEAWVGDATRLLAARIARQVKQWIGTLPRRQRGGVLRPEDVMILVKRRGELASLIVARLYAEGVPVAGVDRLRLNAPLAVQDLLAAIRFVLQPEDDLSLAALLVSPLLGWTQEELLAAAPRARKSLWSHLRDTQPVERLAPLHAMLARADFATPYRFLEELLTGPLDGRRKLLRRLGEEARDPVEELLNAALNFEQTATPSLQRFLDWFDRGDVEIVRDPAQPHGAVRVMTAHGSKGLQAPLVILADATGDPETSRRDFYRWAPEGHAGPAFPIFRPRRDELGGGVETLVAQADERELEEHWRLFYVAATRAEEHLVIAGALPPRAKGEVPQASWYAAARGAFDALAVPDAIEDGTRVFSGLSPEPQVPGGRSVAVPVAEPSQMPFWLRQRAPEEARPPRPLAPSSLGEDDVAAPPPEPAMRAAAERGRLLHALFERLPQVARDRRGAALRWLAASGGVDVAEAERLADQALAVIEDPRFAEIFGPDALAEAPIAAVVEGLVVSGTVDRLVVLPDRVFVVDFKTGRGVPASVDAIPPYHLRQMAAYADALRVVFPGRRVEAALLYTGGPRLYELPEALLQRHKPSLARSEQSLPTDR